MFYGNQVIWPPHCIIGSKGAKFHKNLMTKKQVLLLEKALEKILILILVFMKMTELHLRV